MFFRFASARIILGTNLAIVAFIYVAAAPSSDFYSFLFAGVMTILQVFVNLAFAISIHFANRIAKPPLGANANLNKKASMPLCNATILIASLCLRVALPGPSTKSTATPTCVVIAPLRRRVQPTH